MTRRCLIVGHRGARGLYPENTLAGFAGAIASGVDAVEMDVAMTSDGIVVVSHDPALNPDITRDETGAWLERPGPLIRSIACADLAGFDVGRIRPGTAYASEFPDQQAHDGAHIPRLRDVLATCGEMHCIIELKTFGAGDTRSVSGPNLAEAVITEVDAASAATRVTIESFDWRGPRHVRRIRPDIRVAWLTRAETVHAAAQWWGGPHVPGYGGSVPRAVAAEGGPIWAPDSRDLSEKQIAEAHELGLLVIPWTVNNIEDMRRLIAAGIDGLVTDRPDLAKSVLAASID